MLLTTLFLGCHPESSANNRGVLTKNSATILEAANANDPYLPSNEERLRALEYQAAIQGTITNYDNS